MREIPRYLWYERFSGGDNYNDTKSLNFGFGQKCMKMIGVEKIFI